MLTGLGILSRLVLTGAVPLLVAAKGAQACEAADQPYGLIRDVYQTLGGEGGNLLCPLAPERDGPSGGRVQDFRNGGVAWSPNVAPHAFHAVYRAGMNLRVVWGVEPWSYDIFILRWDVNGQNMGQIDVDGDQRRADIPILAEGLHSISFQGCDRRPSGTSRCNHGWSNPISFYVNKSGYCRAYSLEAESKGQLNRNACRHKGSRWEASISEHYTWCMSISFKDSRSETEIRARDLSSCLAIANPNLCTRFPCPPESSPNRPPYGRSVWP
ncbi:MULTISPECIES: hypothetical protein [unclassified Paracoccus (in: Bacteria)]|uniref:LGFP repeat-containing protein n=1 Tax=unclassified Paracoccus (in: a-proteobacteria) TaxID=2688777 RepID=UPI0012B25D3A